MSEILQCPFRKQSYFQFVGNRLLAVMILLLGVLHPSLSYAQQTDERPLTFGITGSESGSYSAAMSQVPVQRLLLDIAASPRKADFVDAALKGAAASRQDLENLGLIRQKDDTYVINFVLFTNSDVRKINSVSEKYAILLADAFLERRPEIEAALSQYDVRSVDKKAVAYIILGCFSLDWDGLDITAENGYRSKAKERSNGDKYIPWAVVKGEDAKAMFKGSHNAYRPDVVFTSFGDHFSLPRYALPDLFLRLPSIATPPETPKSLRPKMARVVQQSLNAIYDKAGKIMLLLREGDKSSEEISKTTGLTTNEVNEILALFIELDYVRQNGDRYSTLIPVLTKRDTEMVQKLRRIGNEVISTWLAANYEKIKGEMVDITPIRYGVAYPDGFTEIWHYLFGITNRKLVEATLFSDPYAADRKYKGFISTVWDPSLSQFGR